MNSLYEFENTDTIASFQYTYNRIIIRYVDNMPSRAMIYNLHNNQILVVYRRDDGTVGFDQKFKLEFDIPVIGQMQQSLITTIMGIPRDQIDSHMAKMIREALPTTLYVFDQDCVQYFIVMNEEGTHKQRSLRVFEYLLLHDCGGISRLQHPAYVGMFRHHVDKPPIQLLQPCLTWIDQDLFTYTDETIDFFNNHFSYLALQE